MEQMLSQKDKTEQEYIKDFASLDTNSRYFTLIMTHLLLDLQENNKKNLLGLTEQDLKQVEEDKMAYIADVMFRFADELKLLQNIVNSPEPLSEILLQNHKRKMSEKEIIRVAGDFAEFEKSV